MQSHDTEQLYLAILKQEAGKKPIVENLYTLSKDEVVKYTPAEQTIKHWLQTDLEAFSMLEDAFAALKDTIADVERKLKGDNPVPSVRDELIRINSALLSYLSIAKLYLDHTAGKISSKNPDILNKHKLATNEEFDNHFAYRFFYQLRNYAQHRGLPLTGLNATGSINLDTRESHFTFELFFIKKELLEYKKIWTQKVYPDLESSPERIYALPLIEEFMQCMHHIRRASVRAFLPLINSDIEFLREMISKGQGFPTLYMTRLDKPTVHNGNVVGDVHFREVPINLIELANTFQK